MKSGAELIADERQRQATEKGWTAEHDDTHHDGSLAMAAVNIVNQNGLMIGPPWTSELAQHVAQKYRNDRVRQLVIAGALIAAEIDRLQRAK